jgi:hypothetical protein
VRAAQFGKLDNDPMEHHAVRLAASRYMRGRTHRTVPRERRNSRNPDKDALGHRPAAWAKAPTAGVRPGIQTGRKTRLVNPVKHPMCSALVPRQRRLARLPVLRFFPRCSSQSVAKFESSEGPTPAPATVRASRARLSSHRRFACRPWLGPRRTMSRFAPPTDEDPPR